MIIEFYLMSTGSHNCCLNFQCLIISKTFLNVKNNIFEFENIMCIGRLLVIVLLIYLFVSIR